MGRRLHGPVAPDNRHGQRILHRRVRGPDIHRHRPLRLRERDYRHEKRHQGVQLQPELHHRITLHRRVHPRLRNDYRHDGRKQHHGDRDVPRQQLHPQCLLPEVRRDHHRPHRLQDPEVRRGVQHPVAGQDGVHPRQGRGLREDGRQGREHHRPVHPPELPPGHPLRLHRRQQGVRRLHAGREVRRRIRPELPGEDGIHRRQARRPGDHGRERIRDQGHLHRERLQGHCQLHLQGDRAVCHIQRLPRRELRGHIQDRLAQHPGVLARQGRRHGDHGRSEHRGVRLLHRELLQAGGPLPVRQREGGVRRPHRDGGVREDVQRLIPQHPRLPARHGGPDRDDGHGERHRDLRQIQPRQVQPGHQVPGRRGQIGPHGVFRRVLLRRRVQRGLARRRRLHPRCGDRQRENGQRHREDSDRHVHLDRAQVPHAHHRVVLQQHEDRLGDPPGRRRSGVQLLRARDRRIQGPVVTRDRLRNHGYFG